MPAAALRQRSRVARDTLTARHVMLTRQARLIRTGSIVALAFVVYFTCFRSSSQVVKRRGTCTLLLNVFSRPATVRDTLAHYARSSSLDHIVVIWASPIPLDSQKRLVPDFAGAIPVSFVFPPNSSLNYRFYPWPEIRNECVMHMDDDWRMPLEHIARVVQVWHTPGYSNLWIGMEHMGRNHVYLPQHLSTGSTRHARERDTRDEQELAIYAPTFWSQYAAHPKVMPDSAFHSIVLPSGSALSLTYMRHYTQSRALAPARAVVDELTNCEDLLMNLIVAATTGAGPVFVRAWHKPFIKDGLWFRPKHLKQRSDCLRRFEKLGIAGLRYSNAYVQLGTKPIGDDADDHMIRPVEEWTFSEDLPIAYPCNKLLYQDEGICELVDSPHGQSHLGEYVV